MDETPQAFVIEFSLHQLMDLYPTVISRKPAQIQPASFPL